jgi:hypothetical protein
MGDSMAQGFKNGGVYRTDLSFPAILAQSLDPSTEFDLPSFSAQAGIPINIEALIRGLAEKYKDGITLGNSFGAGSEIYSTLRRIKSYWEGHLKTLKIEQDSPFHNQAIWGFTISDTMLMNEEYCRTYIQKNKPEYSVFNVLPDHAMYITARMVLNPSFSRKFQSNSMLDNVKLLSDDGGIENLIVCIGHNNIVGAVTNLNIKYSEESDLNARYAERKCTVFRPDHFKIELKSLYEKVAHMNIKNVFVPTIPYVTIPPAIRGVNNDKEKPRTGYFDYYSRFWIWDEDFDPDKHPHLTRDDAIELDIVVDRYNAIIHKLADEFDFCVVPVHKYVRAAARRRLGKDSVSPFPPDFVRALQRNEKTSYLVEDLENIRISTDYLRLDENTGRIDRGGIFSLDGLHPSTIGYGLIANIYKMSMEKHGVEFENPIDWDSVIENETLVTDPPPLMKDLRLLLKFLSLGRQERLTFLGKNLFQLVLEAFSSKPELD